MKQFILVHTWKYGEQPYLMNCNSTEDGIMENIHSICEMMGINFEEDNEELRQWRINSWKNRIAPEGYAFPGDPRKWEQIKYKTAELSELGKKLLGVIKW